MNKEFINRLIGSDAVMKFSFFYQLEIKNQRSDTIHYCFLAHVHSLLAN